VKVFSRIIAGTKKSEAKQLKPSEAATRIQSVWKGKNQRKADRLASVRNIVLRAP
jgi:hypothetical protein